MLATNHRAVINKLVKSTIRADRHPFMILFITILLSVFMLISVFTTGLTYLDLSRLQNTRLYGSEHDIVIMNGFTQRQKELLCGHSKVASVGVLAYCGNVKSTDSDQTVKAALLWGDQTYWEVQKTPARTDMTGHYPQKQNELLATEKVLAACGNRSLSVGDSLTMTYEDHTGIHTKDFVISGIWNGYGTDQENFYVSESFYKQTGSDLNADGILQIRFKRNHITGKTIEQLKESLHLSSSQAFQASDYIEKSLTILLAITGLCFMICLSACLLIYNILYLSVCGKIRYYGLLQTLGMTQKQLVRFIRTQTLTAGACGMIAGVISGTSVSLLFIPYVMNALGISVGNTGFRFYAQVPVLSIFVTGIAILCGAAAPIRIAANVTPVEAVTYRESAQIPYSKKKRKGNLYWYLAKDQLRKNKKRTVVVFLSLATSFIVFFCLTTLIDSQGRRTLYPNYWNADFIVYNQTQTTEDIASLRPAINDSTVSDIKETTGVADVHTVQGIPVVFPYEPNGFSDFWIKSYTQLKPYLSYSETVSDYRQHPEKYYGMLKGIDEAEFDYLNESLAHAINKQDFLNGKTAVLQYAGFEIPDKWTDGTVSFWAGNQTRQLTIGAIHYGDYYGATVNCGANLIVSKNYIKTLTANPYILSLNIKYEQSFDADTEDAVKNSLEKSSYRRDLVYLSKYDDRKTIQDSQSGMYETGTVISLLLLTVGMLNYINTMTGSIRSRKLTFSIMESVGMSEKQVKKLLLREGILYAGGAVLITLTIGTGITYFVFQSVNYMKIPFTIPVFPMLCALLLLMILCMITPVISYERLIKNRSLTERLRDYE